MNTSSSSASRPLPPIRPSSPSPAATSKRRFLRGGCSLKPQYLILDEPTRGIDVGTKVEIQKLVLKLAEEGVSVTFISSEIEEMLRTCSRLIVMRDREIVGELMQGDMTQAKIMRTIAGEAAQNG